MTEAGGTKWVKIIRFDLFCVLFTKGKETLVKNKVMNCRKKSGRS